jgi:hypothetical protein
MAVAAQCCVMNSVGRTIHAVLGLWHGLAAIQNIFDTLASIEVAPGLRPIASKNFQLIGKLLERLHPAKESVATLLTAVAAVEAIASVSFLRGAVDGEASEDGFAVSLALFGAFFLIDDAFDGYKIGSDHRAIFTLVAVGYAASRTARA